MAATAGMIKRVRLMTDEYAAMLGGTETVYSDDQLVAEIIEEQAQPDSAGVQPGAEGWVPTYDLNLAAAAIWSQKAAAFAAKFNFSADGASFSLGQQYDHAVQMVNHYQQQAQMARRNKAALRKAGSYKMIATPAPEDAPGYATNAEWIGNLPETDIL